MIKCVGKRIVSTGIVRPQTQVVRAFCQFKLHEICAVSLRDGCHGFVKHHDVRACLAEFCHTPYYIGGSGGTSLALLWCVIRQFRGGQRELQTERGQRENTPLQEDGDRADAVLRHIHLRYARKQVGLVAHLYL